MLIEDLRSQTMRRTSFLILLFVLFSWSESVAVEAPLNFQLGTGTTTSPPDWNFSVPRGANRTQGVAPLSVIFSAGLTKSSPTERSFHNYEYSWNFGDPSSGTWGTTGASKNRDKGPVAAHIYETPGNYTATLIVRNASGVVDTETYAITVNDSDVFYSGEKTTCISDTQQNDFTGCPVGAKQVSTDNISDISSYTEAGERVLFSRGSEWNQAGPIRTGSNAGSVTIGAYGACTSPDDLGICSNAPVINVTGASDQYFMTLNYRKDWRVMDLRIACDNVIDSAIHGIIGAIQNNLIMRNEITGSRTGIGFSHWRKNLVADVITGNAVVENDVSDATSNNIYFGSEYLAVLGNKAYDARGSHSVRIWQSYIGAINHNIFSGANVTNVQGRHALKLHGPSEKIIGLSDGGVLDNRTAFTVVYDNVFGTSGPWPLSVGPQNAQEDERLTDIIIEGNKQLADYGTKSLNNITVGLSISARYVTARNNILMGESGNIQYVGINIFRRGIEPAPVGVECYNNTIYSPGNSNDDYYGVKVQSVVTSTILRNNLASFPNAIGTHAMLLDSAADTVASNNTLTDTPGWVDPDHIYPLSRDFSLRGTSPAIDHGVSVPVFRDFIGTFRTQGTYYDLGAFEYYQ